MAAKMVEQEAYEVFNVLELKLRKLGLQTGRAHDKKVVHGAGIIIAILQDSIDKFMDIIKPYMLEPYLYKIKYRGAHPVLIKSLGEH